MPNMHPVMMTRSNSAMSEMEYRKPSDYEQTENRIDHLKGDMELPQAAEKDHSPEANKDVCVSEVPLSKKEEESDDAVSTRTHGDSRKRKQWWQNFKSPWNDSVGYHWSSACCEGYWCSQPRSSS
jgi:hypothetical protein